MGADALAGVGPPVTPTPPGGVAIALGPSHGRAERGAVIRGFPYQTGDSDNHFTGFASTCFIRIALARASIFSDSSARSVCRSSAA